MKLYIIGAVGLVLVGTGVYYWTRVVNVPNIRTVTVQRSPITQEVPATGNVAAPVTINLQFEVSGKLAILSVKTGDKVSSGKLLARLDTSVLDAQLKQAKAALSAQKAQLAILQEGARAETLAIIETQIANDKIALAQANQNIVDSIRTAYTVSDSAITDAVDHFFNNPHSSNPQIIFLVNDSQLEINLESERLSVETALAAWSNDIATLSVSSDLNMTSAQARDRLDLITKILADSSAALSNGLSSTQANQNLISQWMGSIATARNAVDVARAALTSASAASEKVVAALESDEKNLVLEKAGSTASTISAQQAQVDAAEANVDALEAGRTQTQLISPINGTIADVAGDIGETILPGTIVVKILPDSKLQIDVNLSEDNVAKAKVGQPARIKLEAFGDETWSGTVTKIDPTETLISGAVYYKTTIAFNRPDDRLRPGMTANIWIQTGAAPSALVVPASAIQKDGQGEFVRVYKSGAVVERRVTTGLRGANGDIEIVEGLSDGERVVIGTL